MAELDASHHLGTLHADGRVVQKSAPRASFPDEKAGVEVNVSKVAVEPVWFLPGMAERFGIKEELLRRCLFEGESGRVDRSLHARGIDPYSISLPFR
jgi:hypothetical protein